MAITIDDSLNARAQQVLRGSKLDPGVIIAANWPSRQQSCTVLDRLTLSKQALAKNSEVTASKQNMAIFKQKTHTRWGLCQKAPLHCYAARIWHCVWQSPFVTRSQCVGYLTLTNFINFLLLGKITVLRWGSSHLHVCGSCIHHESFENLRLYNQLTVLHHFLGWLVFFQCIFLTLLKTFPNIPVHYSSADENRLLGQLEEIHALLVKNMLVSPLAFLIIRPFTL